MHCPPPKERLNHDRPLMHEQSATWSRDRLKLLRVNRSRTACESSTLRIIVRCAIHAARLASFGLEISHISPFTRSLSVSDEQPHA